MLQGPGQPQCLLPHYSLPLPNSHPTLMITHKTTYSVKMCPSPSKDMCRTLGSLPHCVLRPMSLLTGTCALFLWPSQWRLFPPMGLGQRQRPFSVKFLELQETGIKPHPMFGRTRVGTTLRLYSRVQRLHSPTHILAWLLLLPHNSRDGLCLRNLVEP